MCLPEYYAMRLATIETNSWKINLVHTNLDALSFGRKLLLSSQNDWLRNPVLRLKVIFCYH